MECLSTMCKLSIICTSGFSAQVRQTRSVFLKSLADPTARKHVLVFVLKKLSQHSMLRHSCIIDIDI